MPKKISSVSPKVKMIEDGSEPSKKAQKSRNNEKSLVPSPNQKAASKGWAQDIYIAACEYQDKFNVTAWSGGVTVGGAVAGGGAAALGIVTAPVVVTVGAPAAVFGGGTLVYTKYKNRGIEKENQKIEAKKNVIEIVEGSKKFFKEETINSAKIANRKKQIIAQNELFKAADMMNEYALLLSEFGDAYTTAVLEEERAAQAREFARDKAIQAVKGEKENALHRANLQAVVDRMSGNLAHLGKKSEQQEQLIQEAQATLRAQEEKLQAQEVENERLRQVEAEGRNAFNALEERTERTERQLEEMQDLFLRLQVHMPQLTNGASYPQIQQGSSQASLGSPLSADQGADEAEISTSAFSLDSSIDDLSELDSAAEGWRHP